MPAREPLIKSRMAATAALREGMQGAGRSEWSIPFTSRAALQAARKAPSRKGCGRIGRSLWRAPRHRRPSYDLRRASCDHPAFASNAAHEGLDQRFHREPLLLLVIGKLFSASDLGFFTR